MPKPADQVRKHAPPAFGSMVQSLKDSLQLLLTGSSGQLQCGTFQTSKEATLKISSTDPNRAPIELTLDADFGAYLKVGKGSIFEIPFESKRYSERGFMDSIAILITSVMKNGFEEDVLISKGVVVGASGIIEHGGSLAADATESWRKIGLYLFSKREREHHTYQPY